MGTATVRGYSLLVLHSISSPHDGAHWQWTNEKTSRTTNTKLKANVSCVTEKKHNALIS